MAKEFRKLRIEIKNTVVKLLNRILTQAPVLLSSIQLSKGLCDFSLL